MFKRKGHRSLQRLDNLISQPGQQIWLEDSRLTAKHLYRVNLLAYWQPGCWNLPDPRATLKAYRVRMWIEETFGDLKGHGFDLESTHLRHFLRLSVLTLAVILLYVWLLTLGLQVIKAGQRHLVDCNYRRDYSLFRIGRNMAERVLINGLQLRLSLKFYT